MNKLPTTLLPFSWYFIKKQPWAFLVFFITPMAVVLEANIIPYALKMIVDGSYANRVGNYGLSRRCSDPLTTPQRASS